MSVLHKLPLNLAITIQFCGILFCLWCAVTRVKEGDPFLSRTEWLNKLKFLSSVGVISASEWKKKKKNDAVVYATAASKSIPLWNARGEKSSAATSHWKYFRPDERFNTASEITFVKRTWKRLSHDRPVNTLPVWTEKLIAYSAAGCFITENTTNYFYFYSYSRGSFSWKQNKNNKAGKQNPLGWCSA